MRINEINEIMLRAKEVGKDKYKKMIEVQMLREYISSMARKRKENVIESILKKIRWRKEEIEIINYIFGIRLMYQEDLFKNRRLKND